MATSLRTLVRFLCRLNAALQSAHMNSFAPPAICDGICCWAFTECMTHRPSTRGSSLPAVGTDNQTYSQTWKDVFCAC